MKPSKLGSPLYNAERAEKRQSRHGLMALGRMPQKSSQTVNLVLGTTGRCPSGGRDSQQTQVVRQFAILCIIPHVWLRPKPPNRCSLTLAQELLTRGIQAIKADSWGAE